MKVLLGRDTFVHGRIVPGPFPIFIIRFPIRISCTFPPLPPCTAIAIEGALTGNCDVLAVVSVDQGRKAVTFHTFPADQDRRKIVHEIIAEQQRRPLGYFQVNIALQMDRAGVIRPIARDQDPSATGRMAFGNRFLYRLGAVGLPIGYGTELCYVKVPIGKRRGLYVL